METNTISVIRNSDPKQPCSGTTCEMPIEQLQAGLMSEKGPALTGNSTIPVVL